MKPKRTILVIDDDLTALASAKILLTTRGYKVATATNGEEGLKLFSAGCDLVLVNDLPPIGEGGMLFQGMDGLTVTHQIKQLSPETPVILFSRKRVGWADSEADKFLPKGGWSNYELLEHIRHLTLRKRGPKRKDVQGVPASYQPERTADNGR